jgi:hypothetical protein
VRYTELLDIDHLTISLMRKRGASIKEISEATDLDPYHIRRSVVDQDLPTRRESRDWTEARRLREDGMTLDEIGKMFGVTRERIRQVTLGVTKRAQPEPEWTPEAIRMTLDDQPVRVIAETLGVKPHAISKALVRAGVTRPVRVIQHGTTTKYAYGCRCEACRAANTARVKDYLHRIGQERRRAYNKVRNDNARNKNPTT